MVYSDIVISFNRKKGLTDKQGLGVYQDCFIGIIRTLSNKHQMEIVNGKKGIFAKSAILDVWQGS